MRRAVFLAITFLAGALSGLSKQLEVPQLVARFEHAGIPAEILSLIGATEFVLALALLFPRTRKPAAALLACCFGATAFLLWPQGFGLTLGFYLAMVPLVLYAALWPVGGLARRDPYMGAIPLGFSKSRR